MGLHEGSMQAISSCTQMQGVHADKSVFHKEHMGCITRGGGMLSNKSLGACMQRSQAIEALGVCMQDSQRQLSINGLA